MLNVKTMIVLLRAGLIIVARNNIVWELARGDCFVIARLFR